MLHEVVILMRESTRVLNVEVGITIFNNTVDMKLQGNSDSCQRKCPPGKRKNLIYYTDVGAGLGDRKTIMNNLANLGGFLCAEVILPPPVHLLTPLHNNGKNISENLIWQDFYNLTFKEDNEPAIKDAREEFGHDFTDWGTVPLFDVRSRNSKYNGWFHVISKNTDWKDDYYKVLDYSYSHGSHQHGFIWELDGKFYKADIFGEVRLNGPSTDLLSKLPKNTYRPRMRPQMKVSCGKHGIRTEKCRGCIYTNEGADPSHLKMMKKMLEERILNQALPDSYLGHLHIRRGDTINVCDTSLKRMKEYFQCSLNDTKSLERKITLLMTSDEKDDEYRKEMMALINNSEKYPHVSILDCDKMVKNVMQIAVENQLISKDFLNNYYIFAVEYLLRDWSNSFIDFHMIRRRSNCAECIPLKERLGKVQK